MTEVVVTTEAITRAKLQSNHQYQQTNTQLFMGRMPFVSPNSVKPLKEKVSHSTAFHDTFHGLAYPSSPGRLSTCLWPLKAPGYLWGGLPCLWSALLMPVPHLSYMMVCRKFSDNSKKNRHSNTYTISKR